MPSLLTLPLELLLNILSQLNDPMSLFNLALVDKSFNSTFMPLFLYSQEPFRVDMGDDEKHGTKEWKHVTLFFPLVRPTEFTDTRPDPPTRTRVPNALSGLFLYFSLERMDHLECRICSTSLVYYPYDSYIQPFIQGLVLLLSRLKSIRRLDLYFDNEVSWRRQDCGKRATEDVFEEDLKETFRLLPEKGCQEFHVFDRSIYTPDCYRRHMWNWVEPTARNWLNKRFRFSQRLRVRETPSRGASGGESSAKWRWKGVLDKTRKLMPGDASAGNDDRPTMIKDESLQSRTSSDRPYPRSDAPTSHIPTLTEDAVHLQCSRHWTLQCWFILRESYQTDLKTILTPTNNSLTRLTLSNLSNPVFPEEFRRMDDFIKAFPKDNVLQELKVEWCFGITIPVFFRFLANCRGLRTLAFDRCIPFFDSCDEEHGLEIGEQLTIDFPQLQTLRAPTDWLLLFLHVRYQWQYPPRPPHPLNRCLHNSPYKPEAVLFEFAIMNEVGDTPSLSASSSLPRLQNLAMLTRAPVGPFFVYRQCTYAINAVLATMEDRLASNSLTVTLDAIFSETECLDCDVDDLAIMGYTSHPPTLPGSAIKTEEDLGPPSPQLPKPILSPFKTLKDGVSKQLFRKNADRLLPSPQLHWAHVRELMKDTIPKPPNRLWKHISRITLPNKAPVADTYLRQLAVQSHSDVRRELTSLARWVISFFPGASAVEMMHSARTAFSMDPTAEEHLDQHGVGFNYWAINGGIQEQMAERVYALGRCTQNVRVPSRARRARRPETHPIIVQPSGHPPISSPPVIIIPRPAAPPAKMVPDQSCRSGCPTTPPTFHPRQAPLLLRNRERGVEAEVGWERIGEQVTILRDVLEDQSRRAEQGREDQEGPFYAWETLLIGERRFSVRNMDGKKDTKGKGKARI